MTVSVGWQNDFNKKADDKPPINMPVLVSVCRRGLAQLCRITTKPAAPSFAGSKGGHPCLRPQEIFLNRISALRRSFTATGPASSYP